MYLSLVPNMSRFQRLVRSWQWEDEKKQYQKKLSAMFSELPPEMRTRYAHVAGVCEAIRVNYSRLSATLKCSSADGGEAARPAAGYVRLLWAAHQQREYLPVNEPGGHSARARPVEEGARCRWQPRCRRSIASASRF